MSDLVQSAIEKLEAGDAHGFRSDIRTSLMDRVADRLDVLRAEVGVTIFPTEDPIEPETEEELETDA